jgi:ATP-dependent Clp protease ATP-binding subunit ClpC
MTFEELKNNSKIFNPALALDDIAHRSFRKVLKDIFFFITVLFFLVIVFERIVQSDSSNHFVQFEGFFFIALAFWIMLCALEFFYNSYFFLGREGVRASSRKNPLITFDLATLVYKTNKDDLTGSFLASSIGGWIMIRGGINLSSIKAFLQSSRIKVSSQNFQVEAKHDANGKVCIEDYVRTLFSLDTSFSDFVLQAGSNKEDVLGCCEWFEWQEDADAKRMQWWTKEHLGRIPGLAKDWTYGATFYLNNYGTELFASNVEEQYGKESGLYGEKEAELIEAIISRSKNANALLIAEKGEEGVDIIKNIAQKIVRGSVFSELQHKRMFVLNTNTLIAFAKEKALFEQEMIKVLNEAIHAGNIILIIEDFPEFIVNAKTLGSDIFSVMETYLASPDLQFIALADPVRFHNELENRRDIMSHFEKVIVKPVKELSLMHHLESQIEKEEARSHIFFRYSAVKAIADSAERYFSDTPNVDQSSTLISEILSNIKQQRESQGKHTNRSAGIIVSAKDVLDLIEKKTGIPLGEMSKDEKGMLLNLEATLHQRIIGQEEAVTAIANAMRRARSGINNPNRPMGSFLFLGPTGVGKTETAKALASAFFGSENDIMRLDMSEYKNDDSLNRLIGSFEVGKSGNLTSMLRDKQYGLLLLDEFEKASKEVHDLFLQILDEGFFSDMNGNKVNVRNTIIIATSNAGSDLIWQSIEKGENLEEKEPLIIDQIINQAIFKPELLNRFDGIILFRPLTKDDLARVAKLMLDKLNNRLEEKGITLSITPELINFLVEKGNDPVFGARSMNRAIQEKVEEIIAKKIISGEAKAGSVVTLRQADLA